MGIKLSPTFFQGVGFPQKRLGIIESLEYTQSSAVQMHQNLQIKH